ncbi:MAG TPA: hypothetical protein PLB18_11180 [Acidobacteriota bacterium]|nr:hypothetical protein [Acidobacteriota bacterium]
MSKITLQQHHFIEGLVIQLTTLDAIERQSVLALIDAFLKRKNWMTSWLGKHKTRQQRPGFINFPVIHLPWHRDQP